MNPDECYLIPPGTDFSAGLNRSPIEHFFIHCMVDIPFFSPPKGIFAISLTSVGPVRGMLEEITGLPREMWDTSYHCLLVSSLIEYVFSRIPETQTKLTERRKRLLNVLKYIEENKAEYLPVNRLAHSAAMSRSAFIRFFREEMGVSPAAYCLKKALAPFLRHP